MPYRPDPVFNDSLEPDVPVAARAAVCVVLAALLSLCFALAVAACIAVRAGFDASCNALRQMRR